MDKRTIELQNESRVYDGYIKIDEATIVDSKLKGKETTYKRQKVTRPDAVAGIIYNTDTESVVLVKQYRYPTHTKRSDGFIYEAVAGTMAEGEDPKKTFIRECFEEVGYKLDDDKVEACSSYYVSPGYSTEKIYLFIATATNKNKIKGAGGGVADENEDIEICEFHYLQFRSMMDSFVDAKTKLLAYEAHYRKLFDKI